ncbi:MAG: hypothetical protein NZ853_03375 [Leptospiraceae bacterium]|nr:hypothetical protein [Leptospiraceae bacterium]MDW7975214.1 hypothetical protein [Leptospiraceae bacterium]
MKTLKNQFNIFFVGLVSLTFLFEDIYGWGGHYLITQKALSHPEFHFLDQEVEVESFEDFLAKEREGLYKLFKEYYEWLYSYRPNRMNPKYLEKPFDKENPTLASFLKAARLNPETKFYLVNRVLPGEKPKQKIIPTKEVYPYYKDQGFYFVFEDVSKKKVSLRSILITFSDEPDWVMDHHLWEIQEYGYGKQPYGEPEGESSKAPFHMQFMHEPWLVRNFAPFLLEGMAVERIVLFTKLAKYAKKTNHPYWAYRFLAWTLHYYQDLAQPYHARAVPEGNTWYYVRYILSFDKKGFQDRTTQVLKNKHFIYEDFVNVYLEKDYISPNDFTRALSSYLQKEPLVFDNFQKYLQGKETINYYDVVWELTQYSTEHAYELDKSIQKIFGEKYTRDPKYDVERDPEYNIRKVIETLDEDKKKLLIEITGRDFLNTAQITRFAVLDFYRNP